MTDSNTEALAALTNIGFALSRTARQRPDAIAVAAPGRRARNGRRVYAQVTFRELDADSQRIASGLQRLGVRPGTRMVLLVRPGIDFISLAFALFKSGAIVVLIDPGMGREHLLDCLQAVNPEGFVAIPLAHAARTLHRRRFPRAKLNVTVGRRWFWGGPTLAQFRRQGQRHPFQKPDTTTDDPAAIIFTSGSTGPPKGVLYRHGNFINQVEELQARYQIQAGEIDLPSFPLFALFNSAMGVTTVIPDMNPTRPADVNPINIIEAVNDWQVTQAFGSPALWNAVGKYCDEHQIRFPTLRRILSAGAPVPGHVLKQMMATVSEGSDMFTPYGATESLPVASIAASEVLGETDQATRQGAGTCVGTRFDRIAWKVIRTTDQPIATIEEIEELPCGEIGELIVRGPVVTTEYVTRTDANAYAKIRDGQQIWHRMGDLGYLDDRQRFWFCGRKTHRVVTSETTLYTVPCEAIFNQHPAIYRSALVGVGRPGEQIPVIIAEPWKDAYPEHESLEDELTQELFELGQANELTRSISRSHIFLHRSLPVDIRHNAKIFREKLAVWAEQQLK